MILCERSAIGTVTAERRPDNSLWSAYLRRFLPDFFVSEKITRLKPLIARKLGDKTRKIAI
jgi:hypothetical protein